jgi:SAM-dependent methyltransferase
MAMDMTDNFDEAYFQDGAERGTQYKDYLEDSKRNRTYFEIAETIFKLLRPRRALEIGCATGVTLSHLRTFEVEAHGVDVSDWAVENAVVPTVIKATVENLPFDDDYFDVVYSVHALEHITPETMKRSFSELARVCSGYQFHLMPMLETGPYVGDRFGHLINLRTDPTHHLLFEREWWLRQFEAHGYKDMGVSLSLIHDNPFYELSSCQVLMSREDATPEFLRAASAHNHGVAGALSLALNGNPGPGLDVHIARLRSGLNGSGSQTLPEATVEQVRQNKWKNIFSAFRWG